MYGQQKPIIVDEDLCVLDGNKRLQALIDLNIQAVEIIIIEELNFKVDICNLKPSEKIIILELFEEKYSLSQYSSKNASIAVKAIRTILFGGVKHLREYYELKKMLIELHKLNTLLFNQIINQLDSFEISIPEAIYEIKK